MAPLLELETRSKECEYGREYDSTVSTVDSGYRYLKEEGGQGEGGQEKADKEKADKEKADKEKAEMEQYPSDWQFFPDSYQKAITYIHAAFAVAHVFSQLANVAPETKELKDKYLDAQAAADTIFDAYDALGRLYIAFLLDAAKWIAEREEPLSRDLLTAQWREVLNKKGESLEFDVKRIKMEVKSTQICGTSIALCKTRTEDLYVSSQAAAHFIDHPLLQALAGQISDDDERVDLEGVFRLWGDKVDLLIQRQRKIVAKLEEARSTTIDSDLRELSAWLKTEFKEPFPSWKYPLTPVESFDDSGITVSMKFYIDNVRMEKYLRPFNAFTQIRLRIYERLSNAGIIIPFPQRDLNFSEPVKVIVQAETGIKQSPPP